MGLARARLPLHRLNPQTPWLQPRNSDAPPPSSAPYAQCPPLSSLSSPYLNTGNITHKVLACPPPTCISDQDCEGHRFVEKLDLEALCSIDTSADIGTVYSLRFMVYDSALVSREVFRTVQIISPCTDVGAGGTCACGQVCIVCDGHK